jgi:glutamine cyclotransferase
MGEGRAAGQCLADHRIARIDIKTGNVTGWIELAGLLKEAGVTGTRTMC